jgi:type IV pilus assembly protein PilC
MPTYSYIALDARGKETKGTIEVASQNEAIGRVKEMGLFPTKIAESEKSTDKASRKKAKAASKTGGKKGGLNINLNIKIPGHANWRRWWTRVCPCCAACVFLKNRNATEP